MYGITFDIRHFEPFNLFSNSCPCFHAKTKNFHGYSRNMPGFIMIRKLLNAITLPNIYIFMMNSIFFHIVSNDSEVSQWYKVQLTEIRGTKFQHTALRHRENNSVAGRKKSDFKIKKVQDNCRDHSRRSFKNKSLSCPMGQLHWQSISSWNSACLDCWNSHQPSFTVIPPLTPTKPLQSFAANLICKPDGSQTSGMWNNQRVNKKLLIIDSTEIFL